MVTFKAKRTDLLKVLMHLYPKRRVKYSDYRKVPCEITVVNAKITFAARGAEFHLNCITKGSAKVTVPLYLIYNYVELDPSEEVCFEITDGKMKINTLTVNVNTCFFETDKILRTIRLPLNYNEADVIRLINDHTQEELVFNGVFNKVNLGLVNLDKNIISAYIILKDYGVNIEEIKQLIAPKLFKDGKIPA